MANSLATIRSDVKIKFSEIYPGLDKWRSRLIFNINSQETLLKYSGTVFRKLTQKLLLNSKSRLEVKSYPEFFRFKWPSGEYKFVPVSASGELIGSSFWLKRYPFSSTCNDINTYRIDSGVLSGIDNIRCKRILLASHNAHFGHFVGDDLPWILFSQLTLKFKSSSVLKSSVSQSIIRELTEIMPSLKIFDDSAIDYATCLYQGSDLWYGIIDDWAFRSFILRRYLHSSKHCLGRKTYNLQRGEKIFICRTKSERSRVANLPEVMSMLAAEHFTILEITGLSLKETVLVLKNAKVIVAEAGSTTLIASICAPSSALLITLQPRSIIERPTEEMIESGLPYIYYFNDKIKTVIGEPVSSDSIQSSQSSTYCPLSIISAAKKVVSL